MSSSKYSLDEYGTLNKFPQLRWTHPKSQTSILFVDKMFEVNIKLVHNDRLSNSSAW